MPRSPRATPAGAPRAEHGALALVRRAVLALAGLDPDVELLGDAVLPQEHLLGELDLAREQRAHRLAAVDPLDRLADERRDRERGDLGDALAGRQRHGVGTAERL